MAARTAARAGAIGRRRPVRRRVVLAHRRAPAPMRPSCDPGDADRPVSGDAAQPCRAAPRSGGRRAGARERAAGRPRRACGPRWRPPVRGRADHHEHRRRPGGPHRGRDGDARRPKARRDRSRRRFRWAGTRPARRSGWPVGWAKRPCSTPAAATSRSGPRRAGRHAAGGCCTVRPRKPPRADSRRRWPAPALPVRRVSGGRGRAGAAGAAGADVERSAGIAGRAPGGWPRGPP